MGERMGERGTSLAGFRRYTWWAAQGTAVALLLVFIGTWVLDRDIPLWARGPTAVALATEVLATVVVLNRRLADDAPRPPLGWLACAVAAAVALAAFPLALRNYGLWAVAPATTVAVVATYLPPRPRRWLILGAPALAALPGGALSLAAADGQLLTAALLPPALVAFTTWTTLGPLWAWDIAGRLDQARHMSAELAVHAERLRFAADLHDIQGHHLQVIALKSELAARLAGTDPARAAAEMEQVRRLAADALRDTRAVVHGYRRTTLDEEITNAAKVLASAGIDAHTTLAPAPLSPSTRHLLGLVMREATTNVLRHSRAQHTAIRYHVTHGRAHLRVSNDGACHAPAAGTTPGTGLDTLATRLDAAGGTLTWSREGDRFEITASLPATPPNGPAVTDLEGPR